MAQFDLTLYRSDELTYKAFPGTPEQHGWSSVITFRFTFGEDETLVHCANFEATAEQIRELAEQLAEGIKQKRRNA
jgi:hypothetical protein